jgi:hypothetical protein
MALQAALLPSTLSVPKKGSLAAAVKDTAFLSVPQKVSHSQLLHCSLALAQCA